MTAEAPAAEIIPHHAGDPRLLLWKLRFATLGLVAVILAVGP